VAVSEAVAVALERGLVVDEADDGLGHLEKLVKELLCVVPQRVPAAPDEGRFKASDGLVEVVAIGETGVGGVDDQGFAMLFDGRGDGCNAVELGLFADHGPEPLEVHERDLLSAAVLQDPVSDIAQPLEVGRLGPFADERTAVVGVKRSDPYGRGSGHGAHPSTNL
jgi:hypothetical protein